MKPGKRKGPMPFDVKTQPCLSLPDGMQALVRLKNLRSHFSSSDATVAKPCCDTGKIDVDEYKFASLPLRLASLSSLGKVQFGCFFYADHSTLF